MNNAGLKNIPMLPTNLRSLLRHKAIAGLLILEFAVAFGLVGNILSIAWQRYNALHASSGIVEKGLLVAKASSTRPFAVIGADVYTRAVQSLRALPEVTNAAIINTLPFTGRDVWATEATRVAEDGGTSKVYPVSAIAGDGEMLDTLGVQLLRGRGFLAEEHAPFSPAHFNAHVAMITQSLARKMFPGENALGGMVTVDGRSLAVVGVVADVAKPTWDGSQGSHDVVLLPLTPQSDAFGRSLAVQVHGEVDASRLRGMKARLDQQNSEDIQWRLTSYTMIRDRYFAFDRLASQAMLGIAVGVLVIVWAGVAGLYAFWVQQRRPQIAIRRALGAKRRDIMFLLCNESFLLALLGLALGSLVVAALNVWLINHAEVAPVSLSVLVVTAAFMFLVAQAATWAAARRVIRLDPAIAARF